MLLIYGVLFQFNHSFVPESPRWLLTHKRKEEAQKLIAKIIRVNKANIDESVQLELKVLYTRMKLLFLVMFCFVDCIGKNQKFAN